MFNTPIKYVQFSVFPNDMIKKYSVINDIKGINNVESYEAGEPKIGGISDPRLGTTDPYIICETCNLDSDSCPGHFGHLLLSHKMYHFGFMFMVKSLLKIICIGCSKILLNTNELKYFPKIINDKVRFHKIYKFIDNMVINNCRHCGKIVPKIKKDSDFDDLQFVATYEFQKEDDKKKLMKEIIDSNRCYTILSNILDEDWKLLGFNPNIYRPEDLIMKYFPIPPIAIRPILKGNILGGQVYDNLLSKKISEIIKYDKKLEMYLKEDKESSLIIYNDIINLLQLHVATYYNNDSSLPKSKTALNKNTSSIVLRIKGDKGKNGRVRGNLSGKRVNFCARSVITPDPTINVNEIGIPIDVAMSLSFPEKVTQNNLKRMKKIVSNGKYIYPGANYVIKTNNKNETYILHLELNNKEIDIQPGDVIERHLINGDPVLFNRQPSLHKMSAMCHRAMIINDKRINTFRVNPCVCKCYNADFDGDEMTIYVPQSLVSCIELQIIGDVRKQIISPRYSEPIIQFIQDSVIGTYILTKHAIKIDKYAAMNLSSCLNVENKQILNNIFPKELLSFILPNNLNISRKTNDITTLDISKGIINKGVINSGLLNNGILFNTWHTNGIDTTATLINNIQKLAINWLKFRGFTIGIRDIVLPIEARQNLRIKMEQKC